MRLYVNGVLAASRRSDFLPVLPRISSFATLSHRLEHDRVAALRRRRRRGRGVPAHAVGGEVAEHYRIGTTGR